MTIVWQFRGNPLASTCQTFARARFQQPSDNLNPKVFREVILCGHTIDCNVCSKEYYLFVFIRFLFMWTFKKWRLRFTVFLMGHLYMKLQTSDEAALHELQAPLKKVLIETIGTYSFALSALPRTLKKDKDFILPIVEQHGFQLSRLPRAYRDQRAVVKAAVTQNGHAILSASPRLQQDVELYWLAQRKFPRLPEYFRLERM